MTIKEFKNSKISIQVEFSKDLDNEALYELARERVGDDYETSLSDWVDFINCNISEVSPDIIDEILDSIKIKIE